MIGMLFSHGILVVYLNPLGNDMGVSEDRGPYYSTPNSRILFIRTPKYGTVPLIIGNSHIRISWQGWAGRTSCTGARSVSVAQKRFVRKLVRVGV